MTLIKIDDFSAKLVETKEIETIYSKDQLKEENKEINSSINAYQAKIDSLKKKRDSNLVIITELDSLWIMTRNERQKANPSLVVPWTPTIK